MKRIGRLHVITDITVQDRFSHTDLAAMAVSGGADTIQFRMKKGTTREMIKTAGEMKEICSRGDVTLIINDRVDIALAVDADGVHIGQEDFPIPLARKLLGNRKIIGGSAGDMEEAERCRREGVDYIGFGPVYATTSKDDAGPACGNNIIKQVSGTISLPFIAIGGVRAENAGEVIASGAYGIAVISAVCCMDDPEHATRILRETLDRQRIEL